MTEPWIVILIVVAVFLFIVGNFSTVHKTAKKPMRKKSLNDLEETLPRTRKVKTPLDTIGKQDTNDLTAAQKTKNSE